MMLRARPGVWRGIVASSTKRWIAHAQHKARHELLSKVYKPFVTIDKSSPEYEALARSGKVWEDYFHPADSRPYAALQEEYKDLLAQIDEFKALMKADVPYLAKTLVAEYAHQSVFIENNPLGLGETLRVFDVLTEKIFRHTPMASTCADDLAQLALPHVGPGVDSSHLNELKNHILASQWIAETAKNQLGTAGLDEKDVRQLVTRTIRGTDSEDHYAQSWVGAVALDGYRHAPITVASNPLRIFPYPKEVPGCMERFFQWRDSQHERGDVHPMLLACHMTVYFVHIHPFPDGNGRVCRMLMHDYLVRQGYLPVVFPNLERSDYLRMISDAQEGKPDEFVLAVLDTQLEELRSFYWRQTVGKK